MTATTERPDRTHESRLRDTLEDRSREARRAVRRARYRVQDATDAAELGVRLHPLRSVAVAALGGMVVGALLTWRARHDE